MTTTVKIDAHCGPDKQVKVKIYDDVRLRVESERVIQAGDSLTFYVYGDQVLSIKEVQKSSKINVK